MKMKRILLLSALHILLCSAKTVSVHVAGSLFCEGKPWVNASLSIYDKNYVLSDTLITTATTDGQGDFNIQASFSESAFSVKPYVYIENWCNPMKKWWSECAHRTNSFIPDAFVSVGNLPQSTYNMGRIEMSTLNSEYRGLGSFIYSLGTSKACRSYK